MHMAVPPCASTNFIKGGGATFCDFHIAFLDIKVLAQLGSTLKEKNLLLQEQILSLKSLPHFRRQQNTEL